VNIQLQNYSIPMTSMLT